MSSQTFSLRNLTSLATIHRSLLRHPPNRLQLQSPHTLTRIHSILSLSLFLLVSDLWCDYSTRTSLNRSKQLSRKKSLNALRSFPLGGGKDAEEEEHIALALRTLGSFNLQVPSSLSFSFSLFQFITRLWFCCLLWKRSDFKHNSHTELMCALFVVWLFDYLIIWSFMCLCVLFCFVLFCLLCLCVGIHYEFGWISARNCCSLYGRRQSLHSQRSKENEKHSIIIP
jgi:hypothetical protein